MTSHQCRRQSKQSEGALANSRGALKQTELFHLKTDILQLQIKRYFKNLCLKKEIHIV